MRQTIQRQKVLEFLQSSHIHPSAHIIYDHVKKDIPNISRATVYQNVQKLTDEKLITKLEIGHITRFEAIRSPHHHFLCTECHELFDIPDKIPNNIKSSLKKLAENHTVVDVNLTLSGKCKTCKEE